MASPKDDDAMSEGGVDAHQPFSVGQNIRQLNDIDKSIVKLMNDTARALSSVSVVNPADGSRPEADTSAQKEALHAATDSFLDTLHTVDIKMKRQIMALEEAGIVNLSDAHKQEPGTSGAKASLQPDGMGNVGGLDVGWLNSRGAKVEREMESELWQGARRFLEREEENSKTG